MVTIALGYAVYFLAVYRGDISGDSVGATFVGTIFLGFLVAAGLAELLDNDLAALGAWLAAICLVPLPWFVHKLVEYV